MQKAHKVFFLWSIVVLLFSCNNINDDNNSDIISSHTNIYSGNNNDSLIRYSYQALEKLKEKPSDEQFAETLFEYLKKMNSNLLYSELQDIASDAVKYLSSNNTLIVLKIKNQLALCWLNIYMLDEAKALLLENSKQNAERFNDKNLNHEINLFLGTLYYRDEVLDSALYYFSLIDNDKTFDDKYVRTMVLNNIGGIYDYLDEYETAILYFNKALNLARETESYYYIALCMNNLGSSYLALDSLNLAAFYFDNAIHIIKDKGYFDLISSPLSNRGLIYESKEDRKLAIDYFLEALYYDSLYDKTYGIMVSNNNVAKAYLDMGEVEKAFEYAHRNIKLFKKTKNINVIKDTYRILSFCYRAINNIEEAYKNMLLFVAYYDSAYNDTRLYQIQKLEAIYKLDRMSQDLVEAKKEKDIVEALFKAKQKESQYLWVFIALTFIIIVFLIITFRNIRKRHILEKLFTQNETEKAIIELNHKLFTSQINSHFISNILNGIQSLYVNGSINEASQYLSKFNLLLRSLLESSFVKTESLEKSLDFIKLYLTFEKMRFGNRLKYEILLDENVDASDIFLPPLIFQPFVENAIKHGFIGQDYEGVIMLSFQLKKKFLFIEITDNGIGYSKAKQNNNNHIASQGSRGLKLSKDRIELWGKELKKPTTFEIRDYEGNSFDRGTTVKISIPFIKDDYDYED